MVSPYREPGARDAYEDDAPGPHPIKMPSRSIYPLPQKLTRGDLIRIANYFGIGIPREDMTEDEIRDHICAVLKARR